MQEVMQEAMQFATNHTYLSLAWVGLFVAVIFMTVKFRFSKVKDLSRTQATNLINREQAIVVDTRSRDEFRRGHIIDSINLLASEIKNGNIGELAKHKANPVIITCANGTTSRASAENLYKLGFARVYSLKEGIAGWNDENLPLVRSKSK